MGRKRLGKPDYIALAWLRGAYWLGPDVPNANSRTEWKCRTCGHRWWAVYASLNRGTACPVCGIIKRSRAIAKKPEDYDEIASQRGFQWVGVSVQRTGEKTSWQCPVDHVWQASYALTSSDDPEELELVQVEYLDPLITALEQENIRVPNFGVISTKDFTIHDATVRFRRLEYDHLSRRNDPETPSAPRL